jgi:hypothetical protein
LGDVPEHSDPFSACDVCGRTILKGEQVHEYLTPQGQKLGVCVLCRSRAEASGWIPVALAHTIAQEPPTRQRRGEALRERLGRAASRARSTARTSRGAKQGAREEGRPREAPAQGNGHAAPEGGGEEPRPEPPKPRPAKRQPGPRQTKQAKARRAPSTERAAERRQPRRRRGPEAIMRRAVQRFNSSDERRKVAGLIRSLGEPHAAVRADAPRQLAVVTVAWELSWYQWEVSADADGEPVREVAKGDEVSQLADEERAWNAAVADDGSLRLRSASARRKSSAREA